MKRFKKLASFILAAAMVLTMGLTAFADPDTETHPTASQTNQSITIRNATEGSTYSVYKLATWDVVDANKESESITNLKVVKEFADILDSAMLEKLKNAGKNSITLVEDSKYWPINSNFQDLANTIASNMRSGDGLDRFTVETTLSKDSPTANNLEPGYYIILETATSGDVIATVPILVPITSAPQEVYPKSSKPEVTKVIEKNGDVDASTEDITDKVSYRLDVKVPQYADEVKTIAPDLTFTLTDIASHGLSPIVENEKVVVSVVGYYYDAEGNLVADSPLTKGYEVSGLTGVSQPSETEGLAHADDYAEDAQQFTVTFTYQDVKKYVYISVSYQAELDSDAVIGGHGNPNAVKLTYDNNYYVKNEDYDTSWDEVRTYTYKLDVLKWAADANAEGGEKYLEKAKFAFIKARELEGKIVPETDVETGKPVLVTGVLVTGTKEENVTYEVDNEQYAVVFMTDANGKIELKGLDAGYYIVREIDAPDGYALAADEYIYIEPTAEDNTAQSVLVEAKVGEKEYFSGQQAKDGHKTYVVNSENPAEKKALDAPEDQIKIEDVAGMNLPSTGGIGTTIFYVLGALLVVIAGVVLVTRRRMNGK